MSTNIWSWMGPRQAGPITVPHPLGYNWLAQGRAPESPITPQPRRHFPKIEVRDCVIPSSPKVWAVRHNLQERMQETPTQTMKGLMMCWSSFLSFPCPRFQQSGQPTSLRFHGLMTSPFWQVVFLSLASERVLTDIPLNPGEKAYWHL